LLSALLTFEALKCLFKDLLEATRKSMSAGMGEWDLQGLEWSHDEFKQHLLKVSLMS
jgi:hypothetical protein